VTYDALIEKVRAAWPARIILTAAELGVADALDGKSLTAAEAAAAMKTDPRATELLLNALTALGLATKAGDRYANTPEAAALLARSSPTCGAAGLRHHANLWKTWSALTDVVRTGRPAHREPERSVDEYHDFVRAMYDFAWDRAQLLAKALDLSTTRRMLDLGGGPGSYAIACAQRNPGLQAVVFDRPPALDVAREIVAKHGAGGQVTLQAGDFITDAVGGGYDLVLVSQILHSYDEAQCRAIVKKSADALVPGGWLVVQEFLLEEDRVSPPPSALFAINMLVNTAGGRTYTWREVEGWLADAGLTGVERLAFPPPGGVVVGTKAG
jgi:predicted O-methyltransferase YrrM